MGFVHFIVKYVLFILNLIFTVVGVAMVAIGVLLHLQSQNASENDLEVPPLFSFIPIAIIILGCIVFLIAFLGCCGAVTETKCLLVTFAAFMFVLIAVKIYLIIVWNKEVNEFRHTVEAFVNDSFDDPSYNTTFHGIEALFECCGTTGPEVYEILPPTCCGETDINNFERECKIEDAFTIGCTENIDKFIATLANSIRTVLVSVIVFEGLEFIGAVYLCTSINRKQTKPNHVY